MKIRGDLKLLNDLFVATSTSSPDTGKLLYSIDDTGKVTWKDVSIFDVDSSIDVLGAPVLYMQSAVVFDPVTKVVYIAVADNAPGDDITAPEWLPVGGGSGGSDLYMIDENIPGTAPTEDVGGVRSVFRYANDFRDADNPPNPNVPISAGLDSILFPTITPTPSSDATLLANLKARLTTVDDSKEYVDANSKTVRVNGVYDISIGYSYSAGLWSNGTNYRGPVIESTYVMRGLPPALTGGVTPNYDLAYSPGKNNYYYDVSIEYDEGPIPYDNRDNPGIPASGGTLGPETKWLKAAYPIMLGMFDDSKNTTSEISNFINANLAGFKELGDELFIDTATASKDVTSNLYGEVKYPWIIIPSAGNKDITLFKDTITNAVYTTNFFIYEDIPINIYGETGILYDVYIFKTTTSVIAKSNRLILTIN